MRVVKCRWCGTPKNYTDICTNAGCEKPRVQVRRMRGRIIAVTSPHAVHEPMAGGPWNFNHAREQGRV